MERGANGERVQAGLWPEGCHSIARSRAEGAANQNYSGPVLAAAGNEGDSLSPSFRAQGVRGPGFFAAPDRRHAMLRRNRMLCFRLSSGSPGHQSCSTM